MKVVWLVDGVGVGESNFGTFLLLWMLSTKEEKV